NVEFLGDMNAINYMDTKTAEAEINLNSITKLSQRNIFVLSSHPDLEVALRKTELINKKIDALKDTTLALKHTSIELLLPSEELQDEKIKRWNKYWTSDKKSQLIENVRDIEKKYHFKEGSFDGFYKLLKQEYTHINQKDKILIRELFFSELIQKTDDKYYVITQIKTTSAQKSNLHLALESKLEPNMYIINKEYLTNQFVNDLTNDFNHLLNLTLLLVFIIIWLSFGRIELAFITYTPLLLSWIWTMGLMSLFDIKFNIVNIIITTFIFGLGIDYSIFISKGLIQKYKNNQENTSSYKTSILFSAITTIIGVGVLIFAKHPALKSMAAVTVIGLSSVLLLSFTLQPLFFNWLVYIKDNKKRLVPITALNLLGSFMALLVFSVGSLVNTITGFILITLTNGRSRTTRHWFHHILRASSWLMIFIMINVKKNIKGWDHKKFRKPSVIISNHQSHIDIMLMLMLHPKIILLTNDWVQKNFFYGKIVKMADFYPILDHLHDNIELIGEKVKEGYSIMVFPEGTRSETGKISRFHKGAFYLSEKLELDILPIILHGPGDCITKGEPYLKNGRIDMLIGDKIRFTDEQYGLGYVARSKAFRKWYIEQYDLLHKDVANSKYMRKRVELNYIYKGPIVEWYGKIKMNFEKNYEFFHKEIPLDAKIIDLGCGYGYMDYMLLLLAKERQIIGVDFDEEKVLLAKNCNAYQQFAENSIEFQTADLSKWTYQPADVYVIMDTLHYLPQNEQEYVIKQAIKHLNTKGKLIIRDADTSLDKKHKGTKFSEWQSTKVFGFNKTKNDNKQLYFSSAQKIQKLMESFGLKVQLIDQTKLNSNVILIGIKG
ncbi:MAG: 1-acyl-sn-glycerol-3-phosphate acyltransferase, partial [Bacteroidales bacterium]|nr:1-acyl-sn-glycerol-3-phosphate acyltransferase [Bacteroidales bacterium]